MKRTISLFSILACTSVPLLIMTGALPMMASNALAETRIGVHVLLSKDDPPIHIGDGRGAIEDIEHALRSSNPPDHYTWTFKLDEVPDTMIFTVTIFSLTKQWDCPTTAWLNGRRVYDLRNGENVVTGKTTTARFLAEKRHLQVGTNTIEIREEACTDTESFALNDSLIKGLTYVFSNVAAAKGPQLPPAPTKSDWISGVWKGTQQGRYLVNVVFDLRLNQTTGNVTGTAHFKNTERPVQADGRITEGKLDTSSDRAKLILTVLYIGGLQEGTDVTFTLYLGRDGTLRGEGTNARNKTLTLEVSKAGG